jgi:hypothetical protein
VEAGTSIADAGTGSDVTSKMAAPIGWKPEVVASAAGEQVTRSGLRRAYLLLARRPASTYCVASQRPTANRRIAARAACPDILRCYLLADGRDGQVAVGLRRSYLQPSG